MATEIASRELCRLKSCIREPSSYRCDIHCSFNTLHNMKVKVLNSMSNLGITSFLVHFRLLVMAIVDSAAAFEQHCDSIDSTSALKNLLVNQNITTYAKLAFAIGNPQKPPTEEEFANFCTTLNGGTDLTLGEITDVKRMHFESVTIVIANLKSRVAADTGVEGVRKIPNAEKQARLITQQKRLVGISITGELQPSHALIDLVNSMCDSNNVIWIPPSKCSKRETEITMATKEKSSMVSVEQHLLKVAPADHEIKTDTSSDLQWQWAMMRRGIAFDQCGLIKWDTHQLWTQQLLSLLSKDAPAGYSKLSLDQLVRADKELFTVMAQDLQITDKRLTATPAPMDEAMKSLRTDPRITMCLLPLAKGTPRPSNEDKAASSTTKVQPPPKPHPSAKQGSKKKFVPTKRAREMCPAELQGYRLKDSDGNPICWNYNMACGCSETVTNGRCKRGMHKCIKCHKPGHSVATCRVAGA